VSAVPDCSNPGCTLHWTHKGACFPNQMCGTRGCSRPFAHPGICAGPSARDLLAGAKRAPYGPGEFTPYAPAGADRVTLWTLAGAACSSPLGALFGLALLVLLWLSGCA